MRIESVRAVEGEGGALGGNLVVRTEGEETRRTLDFRGFTKESCEIAKYEKDVLECTASSIWPSLRFNRIFS